VHGRLRRYSKAILIAWRDCWYLALLTHAMAVLELTFLLSCAACSSEAEREGHHLPTMADSEQVPLSSPYRG
jgi:hypothetical protein